MLDERVQANVAYSYRTVLGRYGSHASFSNRSAPIDMILVSTPEFASFLEELVLVQGYGKCKQVPILSPEARVEREGGGRCKSGLHLLVITNFQKWKAFSVTFMLQKRDAPGSMRRLERNFFYLLYLIYSHSSHMQSEPLPTNLLSRPQWKVPPSNILRVF